MLELYQFMFSSPWVYLGTMALVALVMFGVGTWITGMKGE